MWPQFRRYAAIWPKADDCGISIKQPRPIARPYHIALEIAALLGIIFGLEPYVLLLKGAAKGAKQQIAAQ